MNTAAGVQHFHRKSQASHSIDISDEFVRVGNRAWALGHIQEVSVCKHDTSDGSIMAAGIGLSFLIAAFTLPGILVRSPAVATALTIGGILSLIAAYFLYDGMKYVVAIKVGGHKSEVFSGRDPQEAGQIKERIERAIAKSKHLPDN
ncbi:DUF6232 family protein [Leisingera sp. XS_AS12]|uniref:DUF6232 family protein n=1 Tax=Leisingera sp. XS_AS12 TaxID=3241294 RepID=UPI0035140573